jgi:hypothetical protein
MRRGLVLATAAAIASQVPGLTPKAQAVETRFPCENFQKNEGGTWLVLKNTFIEGPQVYVVEDNIVTPGRLVLGYDLAAIIAKACPNATLVLPSDITPNLAPSATPGAAPSTAPGTAPPFLARYADANGNIDIRQLTCGHLNDASADEAQLLLAWYSGWYKGLTKARGINLARVRYNSRSVIDYCKSNRDKRLTDVMEQMLK